MLLRPFVADRLARLYRAPRLLHERVVVPLVDRIPVSTANFSFDFRNTIKVEVGALLDRTRGVFGNYPRFGQGLGGGDLDGEPGTKAIFVAPDSAQLGSRVAWDQRSCSFNFVD